MPRLFGRQPRAFNPSIPHLSALRMASIAPMPIPIKLDYTDVLPADLGEMLNDQLGDCTAAGLGHAVQVWSRFAGGTEITVPDAAVQRFYTECTGYDGVPGDATDRGAVEQDVLAHALNVGFPLDAKGDQRMKLAGFVEIDPRNPGDIRRAIYECGVVYLGIVVPQSIVNGLPPAVWDAGSPATNEGHCIVACGYDTTVSGNLTRIVSWGQRYDLTDAFIAAYVDEAYALVSPMWIERSGVTPLGMSEAALEAQMQPLRMGASR